MDLWTGASISGLFAACRHAAVFFPNGKVEADALVSWFQRHPIAVYQTAFAWEELTRTFARTQPHLAGPRGAVLLMHAAYAGLMTGLECEAPLWLDLLAARDQADPLIRFAHHFYEIAHGRDAEAHARALDALCASPPPELAAIVEAAGMRLPAPGLSSPQPAVLAQPPARPAPASHVVAFFHGATGSTPPSPPPAVSPPPLAADPPSPTGASAAPRAAPPPVAASSPPPATPSPPPPSPAHLFAWVHLSDLHVGHGAPAHRWDQQLVLRRALCKDLRVASSPWWRTGAMVQAGRERRLPLAGPAQATSLAPRP